MRRKPKFIGDIAEVRQPLLGGSSQTLRGDGSLAGFSRICRESQTIVQESVKQEKGGDKDRLNF